MVFRGTHLVFRYSLNKHALSAHSGQMLCQAPRVVCKGEGHVTFPGYSSGGVVQEAADIVEAISSLQMLVLEQCP